MDRQYDHVIGLFVPYVAVGIGLYVFQNGWLALGLYHACMIGYLLHHRKRISLQGLMRGWHSIWGWLFPVSALSGLAIALLWPWMAGGSDLRTLLSQYGLSGWKWTGFVFYYALLHPLLEELFWRGSLGHPSRTVRIEDVAFAGYHFFVLICFISWTWAILCFVVLAAAAWVWRQSVCRTGGLFIAAATHVIGDISIILAIQAIK